MKTNLIAMTCAISATSLMAFTKLPVPAGVPLVHMWEDEEPDQTWKVERQYPEVPGIERIKLYDADETNGGYNHHSNIIFHEGVFYCAWSNSRYDEDAPGQRVLYTTSTNGRDWSRVKQLFPSVVPEGHWGWKPSCYNTAGSFVVWKGRLFATSGVTTCDQWTDMHKTKFADNTSKETPFPIYKSAGLMIREIKSDGTLGEVFATAREKIPEKTLYPVKAQAEVEPGFLLPDPGYGLADVYRQNPEGRRFCEPTVWKRPDGIFAVLLRDDCYSHRKWVATSPDGRKWSAPQPTDVYDAPSQSCNIILPDGTVLLIGNHRGAGKSFGGKWHDRDPLMVSVSKDGSLFYGTHAIREGYHAFKVKGPQAPRARGGSAQYPNAIFVGDNVYVLYSICKEDVEVARFPVKPLLESAAHRLTAFKQKPNRR